MESKKSGTTQFKDWVFTLNSKKEGDLKDKLPEPLQFLKIFEDNQDYEKVQFQKEKGELGRAHFQGWFSRVRKITKSGILKEFAEYGLEWIFLEPRRGSRESNDRYTSKSDGRIDGPWGFDRGHGQEVAVGSGQSGKPAKRTKAGFPLRRESGCGDDGCQSTGRCVILCNGPPGIGKTRCWTTILEYLYGPSQLYGIPARATQSSGRWIGEYAGEWAAYVDEFLFSDFSKDTWKVMMDRYDVRLPARMGGKSVVWQPAIFVLLTNASTVELEHFFLRDPVFSRRISLFFDWSLAPVPPRCLSGPVRITHAHVSSPSWFPPPSSRLSSQRSEAARKAYLSSCGRSD